MAAFHKFYQFVEDLAKKVHDLSGDQLKIALTNAAPSTADTVLADITEVAYTYCSTRLVTTYSCEQTSGILKLILTDLTLTASGGSIGPFRYVVLYNDSATGDPLIGWWDYAVAYTVANGGTFKIDFSGTDGVFQIA